jgi:hypothetical protein
VKVERVLYRMCSLTVRESLRALSLSQSEIVRE